MPAAIFHASSFVMRFAADTSAGLRREVDIRHRKTIASRTIRVIPRYSSTVHGGGKRRSGMGAIVNTAGAGRSPGKIDVRVLACNAAAHAG